MSYFIYKNTGGIDKVRKEISNPKNHFESIKEVFEWVVNNHFSISYISDLSIRYYCYDTRLGKDVYMIVTDKLGDEDCIEIYRSPQYVCYLVEI